MISKCLQILGLQLQISILSRSLEQFLLTIVQNNFGNKIPRLTKLCQHFFAEKASLLEASRHYQEKGSKSLNSQNSNNTNQKTAKNKSKHITTTQSHQHPRTIKITSRNPTSSTATKTQKTRQIDSGKGVMQQQQRRTLSFNETSVLIAFILVILTLLIITMAMFKLAGSIGALSERLYTLEDRLAQYSKECQFVNVNVP